MDIPLTPALEFLSWFREQTLAIRRRRPGPHFPAWLASLAPEVEEMVYVRLSFAWSKWAAMLDDGAPVPVTLGQRISVIHGLVFALWERHGVEFLHAYGKTRVRDELGNSEN